MKFAARLLQGSIGMLLTVLIGLIIYYNAILPDNYYVYGESELVISEYVTVRSDEIIPENYVCCHEKACTASIYEDEAVSRIEKLKLFGIFPIKEVSVTQVSEQMVIPCGTPFGIKLTTEGVMVVELTGFESGDEIISPAREAGIEKGDIIISISGKKVSSNASISRIIEESGGQTLGVELERDGVNRVVFIKPEKSDADGSYKAGMWVRDSSAGIGTVTFYNPATGIFGGLGHPVCDVDTGETLPMAQGYSADVIISGINKSTAGDPGELIGMFVSDKTSGELIMNTDCGIFGKLTKAPAMNKAVEVAARQEVHTGYAEIYTTIQGSEAKSYMVEIEKIDLSDDGSCKNLIVHVTDERLLKDAGGIVQGMSGSPIIQDGKLVGAVTHVLVKDPTRGYGIFVDSMIEYAQKAAG